MSGHGNLEEMEETDGFSFRGLFRRYRTPLLAAASLVVFCLVGYAIVQLTNEVRYDDVVGALAATRPSAILLALFFTALSFLSLIFYDLNAIEYIGKKLPFPHVALTAFSAYAVGNTAGFGALSGGAIRYRAYTRLGLSPEDIGRIIAFVTLSFGLGLAGVAAIALIVIADEIGPLIGVSPFLLRLIAGSIVAILGAVMIIGRDGRVLDLGPVAIRLPDSRTWSRQFLVTAFDIAASASVLYVLLPQTAIGWPVFLAVYAIAVGLGVLSHVPAGLGVFETVIIASLGSAVNIDAVLGSLVLYRLVYHVLPLLIAVLAVSAAELRRFVDHPAASSMRRIGGRLMPQLLSALALLLGVMLVFSSVTPTPDQNLEFLSNYLPLPMVEGAHFLSSLLGLALVVAARGLGQRLDGAWWVAVFSALAALTLSLLKAIALVEAAFLAFLIFGLFVSRRLFTRQASLLNQALTASWLMAIAVIVVGAVVILLFVYRDVEYSNQLWWQFEFTAEAPRGLRAVLGITIISSAIAVFSLLRPASFRPEQATDEALVRAVEIVMKQGNADANLVRMGDKSIMFSENGDAFIMYGRQGRSWIALFDPVGDHRAVQELVWRFVEAARAAGCRAVFYQISPALLSHCADAGLRAFKLGELAVADLRTFEMKGGKWANLRQTASRAQRDGLEFAVVEPQDLSSVIDDLAAVSTAWLEHHNAKEKGFSLGAFDFDYVSSQPVGILKKDGSIVAFANILVTESRQEGTIDLMRFSPDAPKGSMDFLFVQIMEYLREQGFTHFNLGMAPLSGMSKREAAPVWDRIGSTVFEHGERFYNFKGLRAFKSKFHPHWQPRYLAVSGGGNPMIALMDATFLIGGGLKGVVRK
ncbi:bifunctional lysylphosphatidylglycerol flippase/synthetase MprF [Rhizobium ruizarguesonis]|uniref:bifunctional lysylphosphatidylglycerol flippase/synthetase MprF n=1 Tax=Rhizobium ruizarguesonis TaxID=2081791 RepID=UPI0010321CAF|nr:bifunctional lysylphosphatidylglycerol flippase/synthetase MprF [Rhizobium ruizarguesonis]TAU28071.1 bifunctional lysylphosphatidylglycerol flippase/synthetase MprF [Rhizobium ruizarguesonis]TAU69887.1 bifunctional lysylphosphatidylglycerol flippase/synthetase MprF [Rhizobium ruizarguesonis]TAV17321.1 bifunctional lysylphosphatidylglycerol flippase/synthetase MprF [Rhizobium ruizarguesonis]TAV29830.1 bifunctional lysylphosphatidylglycerol flippase/synthetase MprF [Rhizobium ruizarguesonis]T